MEYWNPITGKIPPDPPGAPWSIADPNSPAKIIARMRKLWESFGSSPEDAQKLFDGVEQWVSYWHARRADAYANHLSGIRGNPSGGPDTAQRTREDCWMVVTENGIETRSDPIAETGIGAHADVAAAAIIAIHAARQAILTGRHDALDLALKLDAEVQRSGEVARKADARKKGGEARAGDYGPIHKVIEMLVGMLGKDVAAILDQARIDAETYDYDARDSDSEAMGDIRGHASTPVNLRFLDVPDDRKDRKGVIRYEVDGKEKSITIGALKNYVSRAR